MKLLLVFFIVLVSSYAQNFQPDFSTTESSLRSFILQGDVEGASSVLSGSEDVFSLGAGLTQEPSTHETTRPSFSTAIPEWNRVLSLPSETEDELRDALLRRDIVKAAWILRDWEDQFSLAKGLSFPSGLRYDAIHRSPDREHDLDVFTFKAIARVAAETSDDVLLNKLAFISVLSILRDCEDCKEGSRSAEEYDAILTSLRSDFDDKEYLQEVISANANMQVKEEYKNGPVNSFVCLRCWPSRSCQSFWWCSS